MVDQHVTTVEQHATKEMPQEVLWRMTSGCLLSQAIHVATKLNIPGLLKDGPKNSTELAQATETHAPSLYRLLRALAGAGLFVEDEQGRFTLTPLGELLRRDVPGSMAAAGLLFGSTLQWPALGELLYSIQTGKPAFDHHFGMTLWEYYMSHPEEHDIFQYAMSSFSAAETHAILQAYDFSGLQSVVDIAGGHGQLLVAILQAYPEMRGTLLELPEVVRQAEGVFKAAGVAQRCEVVSGDMFASIPAGRDAYIAKTVIHDWQDEQALALLKQCYNAMPSHAKLLLISEVIAPANVPDPSKFMDLNMLVSFGGCERTAAEFEALLGAANLKLKQIIPTRSPLSIVECVKG
ncbi:methyltransferase [Reticulibacter mediterranei]|nr:methyltransferase [Reticulibacter mediterranei]